MEKTQTETRASSLLKRYSPKTTHGGFMTACCTLMVIGAAIPFLSNAQDQTIAKILLSLGPVLGCLAIHFVMHRAMGRSCHQTDHQMITQGKEEPR